MNRNDLLNDELFWMVLEKLLAGNAYHRFDELKADFGLSEQEVRGVVNFLVNLGVETQTDEVGVRVQGLKTIDWKMSLLDWIALQAHFPFLSEHDPAPYHQLLKNFLSKQEEALQEHDFFEAFSTFEKSIKEPNNKFLSIVEDGLLFKKVLRLKYKERAGNIFCFPYRISYLQDELCLIGEDTFDRTLLTLQLKSIIDAKVSSESFRPHFSQLEVVQFITNLREFSESEEHLVLKIYSPGQGVDLRPNYHFFRNASLLKSSRGDYIWSAYVETGEKLFEWLRELSQKCNIEILSPVQLSEDFRNYLFEQSVNFKKVS